MVARQATPVELVFFEVNSTAFVAPNPDASIISFVDSGELLHDVTTRALSALRVQKVFAAFAALPHFGFEVFTAVLAHELLLFALLQLVAFCAQTWLDCHLRLLFFLFSQDFDLILVSRVNNGIRRLILQVIEEMFLVLQSHSMAIQGKVQEALVSLHFLSESGSVELHQVAAKIAHKVL